MVINYNTFYPLRFNHKNNCYAKFRKCLLDVADLRRGCFGDEGLWQDWEGKIHEDKEQSGFEPVDRRKVWSSWNQISPLLQLMWPGLTLPMTGLYQAWDNRTERLDKGRMCTCTCWCTCCILNWEGNKMVNVMQCSRYIICYLRWSDWLTQGTSLLFPFSILGNIVGAMRAVWYRGGWSILHL